MYSLVNEYKELLEQKVLIESELQRLARGYISKKKISGREYCYLQCKNDGKVTSEYLKSDDVQRITDELALRKKYEADLPVIDARLAELENAAQIIGKGTDRTLMLLKISAGMDSMGQDEKDECISFANAMNAIEGVPASEQTADELAQWQCGAKSYMAVFSATLRRYGFAVEV